MSLAEHLRFHRTGASGKHQCVRILMLYTTGIKLQMYGEKKSMSFQKRKALKRKKSSEIKMLQAMRYQPGKYLISCYFQSRWRCCILIGWEPCASPAGGRGLLGASY